MARGYEQTMIVGNVGSDPQMKYLQSGTPVLNFSVAVNTKFGENEKVNWYRVNVWGKLAEAINQYVAKGKQIQVVGTVTASAYKASDGEAKASLELRADSVLLLGGSQGENRSNGTAHQEELDLSDIPF